MIARGRTFWVGALIVAMLGTTAIAQLLPHQHGLFDFLIYHGATNYWLHGGDLYDFALPGGGRSYGFTYPPFAAVAIVPLALLPASVAGALVLLGTVIGLAAVLGWYLFPLAKRHGWNQWSTLIAATVGSLGFEPVSITLSYGQVNVLLLVLVAADVLFLLGRGHRWAGIGIGLAAAIKLTPAVFIGYLLVTRRWRAAAVASLTAVGATVIAGLMLPEPSIRFWTELVWSTKRVAAVTSGFANQSLTGLVARFTPPEPNKAVLLGLLILVGLVWVWRVRQVGGKGKEHVGFAFTAALYFALLFRFFWRFEYQFDGWGLIGSNIYVLITAAAFACVGFVYPRRDRSCARLVPKVSLNTGKVTYGYRGYQD